MYKILFYRILFVKDFNHQLYLQKLDNIFIKMENINKINQIRLKYPNKCQKKMNQPINK